MAERIDLPPTLQGDEKSQLEQMWRYLYQLSESINNNLEAIGGNDLTDKERATMQQILTAAGGGTEQGVSSEYETLKSLIIKTADFVQTSLQEYRMVLFGETEASSQFGQVNRRTGMDVAVTPDGVLQKFSLREIVKDLKTYEVNAKNYIKTGLLRTVNSIPVYGVAIGKDVVTFSEDGTETYNDGNKVAELTADELSFWQNGVKIAGYTGSKISFYYNGSEVFYIQQGKLYSTNDIELSAGKKVIMGNWSIADDGIVYTEQNDPIGFEIAKHADADESTTGLFYENFSDAGDIKGGRLIQRIFSREQQSGSTYVYRGGQIVFEIKRRTWQKGSQTYVEHSFEMTPEMLGGDFNVSKLGSEDRPWVRLYVNTIEPEYYSNVIRTGKSIGKDDNRFIYAYINKIYGGFSWETTDVTNLNNITEPGHYYFANLYSITGKPSDLSNQEGYLEVITSEFNVINSKPYIQKLYANNNVYIRTGKQTPASVSSWYKFTGTAV